MKAPRKYNNINNNSITEKDNIQYDSDSEETQQNSPTDTNPPYRTEDDMRDLNASLG